MKRIVTAANGVVFQPADANEWQDRTRASLPGSKNNLVASSSGKGGDGLLWIPSGGSLAAFTLVQVDDANDWRDRLWLGWYVTAGAAANLPGGTTDYDFRTGVAAPTFSHGYTGSGAYSNITTGAAVAAGSPPIAGAGAFRSYRIEIATSIYLYADPTTGALYLYNNSASTIYPALLTMATGKAGLR